MYGSRNGFGVGLYLATIVLAVNFNITEEMASRKIFHDFDRTHKRLLDRSKLAAGLQEDLNFQKEMHKTELRQLKRRVKKMSEKEQYMLNRLKIDYSELEVLHVVGRGSFGVVNLALYKGESVAVKSIVTSSADDVDLAIEEFLKEVKLTAHLRHANIVDLFGACFGEEDPGSTALVMEYCSRGDLSAFIPKGLQTTWPWVLDVVRGMCYLHGRKILLMHRDIKPDNVLISMGGSAKIGDFGTCLGFGSEPDYYGVCGTGNYASQEMSNGERYDQSTDVFSFGVLLYECVMGQSIAEILKRNDVADIMLQSTAGGTKTLLHYHSNGHRLKVPNDFRVKFTKISLLVSKCWHADVDERPSFEKALQWLEDASSEVTSTLDKGVYDLRISIEELRRSREGVVSSKRRGSYRRAQLAKMRKGMKGERGWACA